VRSVYIVERSRLIGLILRQGKYYTDPGKVGGESSQASDEKLGTNLWELSQTVIHEKLGPDALLPWGAGKK
jgi:hypothetical protein